MKQLSVSTRHRSEFVNITREVQEAVTALGVENGHETVRRRKPSP